jgi:hypothetical protein
MLVILEVLRMENIIINASFVITILSFIIIDVSSKYSGKRFHIY